MYLIVLKRLFFCLALHAFGRLVAVRSSPSERWVGRSMETFRGIRSPQDNQVIRISLEELRVERPATTGGQVEGFDAKSISEFVTIKQKLVLLRHYLKLLPAVQSRPAWQQLRSRGGVSPELPEEDMLQEVMDIWKFLEHELIRLQAEKDDQLRKTEPAFKLKFLQYMYLLGDLIHQRQQVPSNFIQAIEIFKPDTLFQMVEYQIDLQFSKWGISFFEHSGSTLLPHLDSIQGNPTMKHFQRSIKALDAEVDRQHLVYLVLSTFIRNAPWGLTKYSSGEFAEISKGFTQSDFLAQAGMYSGIAKTRGIEERYNLFAGQNIPVVDLVKSAVELFQNTRSKPAEKHEKLQLQMAYYIIKFLQSYHQPLLDTVITGKEQGFEGHFHTIFKQLGGHRWVLY
ncbi:uncharacterized protein PGTG_22379 [Puccinia graminis f. sp. tritici CRL 75-36-700-3]|uniref:Uncharacterized protein n=1 Tax=Puccinia graminis f. sp. tritici (strain CRL 75-36-700-3 / race SCCL) TaxID=418459 RepID=H6QUC7_PUCGT|nr:uncharacterized protein PGTG_22379 [Puccinia graminis f. sp. tritici CRL 75-36-700-3]EHS64590.1 hypothetical protein PGTG_22379 [Puccinia graminis f. sp. tritici CRL 75-36-700-3]